MKKEIIVHENPKSPIAESFRTLRTNIQFTQTNNKLRTILVTSGIPGEGKSWVSSNLAVTFAQSNKQVLIIDADMRKGRQYDIFGVNSKNGLSNWLSGIDEYGNTDTRSISEYIQPTDVDNLYLMSAGVVAPNPSELLSSEKMTETLKILRDMFDIIIIDGTPCMLVSDSIILSRIVDTTVVVVAYKQTKMETLQYIKKFIKNVGGKIGGVVMNKVPASSKPYGGGYYYYGSGSGAKQKLDDLYENQEIAKAPKTIYRQDVNMQEEYEMNKVKAEDIIIPEIKQEERCEAENTISEVKQEFELGVEFAPGFEPEPEIIAQPENIIEPEIVMQLENIIEEQPKKEQELELGVDLFNDFQDVVDIKEEIIPEKKIKRGRKKITKTIEEDINTEELRQQEEKREEEKEAKRIAKEKEKIDKELQRMKEETIEKNKKKVSEKSSRSKKDKVDKLLDKYNL